MVRISNCLLIHYPPTCINIHHVIINATYKNYGICLPSHFEGTAAVQHYELLSVENVERISFAT